MSEKPKPCPNPKCKSDDVEAAYPERGRSHVFCGTCGMRGPSVKCDDPSDDVELTMEKAEAAWNALTREGKSDDAPTEELAGVELKPCPACGPKDQELYITTEPGIAFVVCAGCAMQGPATRSRESAIRRWDALPRPAEPAPAPTNVMIYPFDGMASRVFRFQTIVNGAGNIPSVDAAMLKLLYRELLGETNESALARFGHVWSSELPKVVGWWWTKIEGEDDSEEFTWMGESDIALHVRNWSKNMRFAGPYPEPVEPST